MTAMEPPTKKIKETVYFKGYDGATAEYCPYDVTSKTYDNTRAPLGLNIALGTMCLNDKPLNEQHLLDIGCGTGTFVKEVKAKLGKVVGIEYNDGMIAQFKKLCPDVEIVRGSADKLPFEASTFDACTINQVIHHFPTEEDYGFSKRAFAEAFRVLRPGGHLIISTSTPVQQRDAFWWLELFPKASDAVCNRFPPLDVLKRHMQAAGFEWTAESITVPQHRTLMKEEEYLRHGVKGAFIKAYRDGDSSWSMTENMGELEAGLKILQDKMDKGTADEWLKGREELRLATGQATFVTVMKPLKK